MRGLTLKLRFLNSMLTLLFISFLFVEPASAHDPGSPPANHRVKIWVKSFIPYPRIGASRFGPCFSGDNRSFSDALDASCRTHQEIEFEVTPLKLLNQNSFTGKTHQVNCGNGNIIFSGQARSDGLRNGPVSENGQTVRVKMALAASNPLVRLAPAVDLDIFLDFDWPSSTVTLSGKHDGFPAFEIYMSVDGGKPIKLYRFQTHGDGLREQLKLLPPMDEVIRPVRISLGIAG